EDFRKQFPLVEIKAGYDKEGEPVNFLGATVIAHRTIHSIPCIGFTIKLQDKTLFISGDTLSPKKINEFLDKGIIEKERAEYLINKLNGNYTRALIDGGGGLIHGDPDEFKPRRGLHIVHVNPNMLKNTLHNLLDSGQSLVLIEAKMLNENISYEITKILTSMGISPYDPWMKIFINSGKLVFSQQYEFLALEGEKDFSGLFLVLGGEVEVLTGKKPITKFRRGTYFGELALLEDKRGIRQANIRISSITALLWEIPGEVFQSYVKYSGKKSSFYRIRNAIQRIEAMPVFKGLGGEAITTLARQSEAKFYYEGQIIFKSTPVYFIVFLNEGKLHLVKDGKVLKEFIAYENGTDIDISEIINSYENARLIAKSFVELTLINKKVYHKILDEYTGMGNFRRK
ncbi:MAG: cyclic nucleotide-binding domain-containing protein, partial [Spirochaetota bacterium]